MGDDKKKEFPFTMGCDPECHFMVGGSYVGANSLLELLKGPNDQYRGYSIPGSGSLGTDAGDIGEFRPTHSKDPAEVVENMRKLIGHLSELGRIVSATTKSERGPVGGHVHFGIPLDDLESVHRDLTSYCLPIMLNEDPISMTTRLSQGYGKISGDSGYRRNSVGTYEVRFLSAEWLTTPRIMYSTFSYLGVIMNEILNNPANFKKDRNLRFKNIRQAEAVQLLAVSDYTTLTKDLMKNIRNHVKTFELYPKFKDEVNFILNPSEVIAEKKKVNWDLVKGWGFLSTKPPAKKLLISATSVKEGLKSIDVDKLRPMLSIFHNGDLNTAMFAEELANRILAFKWVPKFDVTIFGLRKGFDHPVVANAYHELLEAEDVKTMCDLAAVNRMVNHMSSKLSINYRMNTAEQARKMLLIGLPYDMRMNGDLEGFLDLISRLEHSEKFTPMKPDKLTDDEAEAGMATLTAEAKAKLGKLHQIIKEQESTPALSFNSA